MNDEGYASVYFEILRKRRVDTANYPRHNSLLHCNSHFVWQMHYPINTFELQLPSWGCVYGLLRVRRVRPGLFCWIVGQAEEARLSLDNIYFNILCVDSV